MEDVTSLVALLYDTSQIAYALRVLINRSMSDENQVIIFDAITLNNILELLKTYEKDEEILPLIVWLLSHLALNGISCVLFHLLTQLDEIGKTMLQCQELVRFHSGFLGRSNKLLLGKTLWLLNNLSLLDECHYIAEITSSVVATMHASMANGDLETFTTCCDILLNLVHKDTCAEYLKIQNDFVAAKGLELILKIITTPTTNNELLKITTAILELLSAYLGEIRIKLIEVGAIPSLVQIGGSDCIDSRASQEQALKTIFNLSFLAGTKEFDEQVIQHECIAMIIGHLLQDSPDESMQKTAINILANLLVSDSIRKFMPKASLASGIARMAKDIRTEQTVMLSSLLATIANAAIDDECRNELRKNEIEIELQRFANNCHPSLRPIINAAKENMNLNGNKAAPIFLDMLGNNTGFVGRILDKRSSLTPSSKRELKPRTITTKPKQTAAEILYSVPMRQYSRFLSGGIGNDDWKD